MSGFVYIWYDRKKKRFYIGSHWGDEKDGYVCSSQWMCRSYKNRKDDFRREILARVTTNRSDLLEEEQRWLDMIKPEECGKRYYNLCLSAGRRWHTDPNSPNGLTIREKISIAKSKPRKPLSEETKRKISERTKGRKFSDEARRKMSESKKHQVQSEETREKKRKSMTGHKHTEETKRKIREGRSS